MVFDYEKLKQQRIKNNLTIKQAAEMVQMPQRTLERWEEMGNNRKEDVRGFEYLNELTKIYHCTLNDITRDGIIIP